MDHRQSYCVDMELLSNTALIQRVVLQIDCYLLAIHYYCTIRSSNTVDMLRFMQ